MTSEIRYGKAEIPVYRLRRNELLAGRVTVEVFGDNFLPAYTQGDNRLVVPTDTMKNFVHVQALAYAGSTHEGLAFHLGRAFLDTYPQMERLRLTCTEVPFQRWGELVYSASHGDRGLAQVELDRDGVLAAEFGRLDMHLLKTTGSAFAGFAHDDYTTLPERPDRPLFVYLDVRWRYARPDAADDPEGTADLVPSDKVAQEVRQIFAGFTSRSIQHLVYEIGQRLLAAHPVLSEVSFEAQNRLWDAVVAEDGGATVYTDPPPAHGSIALRLGRQT